MTENCPNGLSAYENLNKLIKSGRIPHSFLIEGATLEERKKMALYLAKSIVCTGENKPCNTCIQCKTANSLSNVDISFVVPENDKKFISVDKIRALRQEAFVMPHSAQKRVFIIENAELINEQGQNALLKILEEPPKTVVFILLVSSRTRLLPTIISRCSVFIMSGETNDDGDITNDAKEFLSLLFDAKEYDMLLLSKKYEKDRLKTEKFFNCLKDICAKEMSSGENSMYRKKALSKIFDETDNYIGLIKTNINLTLLFSAVVCKYKSFVN